MRSTNAEARVLVIAAGISNEIAGEWRSLGALQFIKKPFEVADFGAAVQALLGPWKNADSAQSRGNPAISQSGGYRIVTVRRWSQRYSGS